MEEVNCCSQSNNFCVYLLSTVSLCTMSHVCNSYPSSTATLRVWSPAWSSLPILLLLCVYNKQIRYAISPGRIQPWSMWFAIIISRPPYLHMFLKRMSINISINWSSNAWVLRSEKQLAGGFIFNYDTKQKCLTASSLSSFPRILASLTTSYGGGRTNKQKDTTTSHLYCFL